MEHAVPSWVRNPETDDGDKYRLAAKIGLTTVALRFTALDDADATMIAIDEIMDRAYLEKDFTDDRKFWSNGAITLYRPNGSVLRTMDAKVSDRHG